MCFVAYLLRSRSERLRPYNGGPNAKSPRDHHRGLRLLRHKDYWMLIATIPQAMTKAPAITFRSHRRMGSASYQRAIATPRSQHLRHRR